MREVVINMEKETIKFYYFDKLLGEFDCPGATSIKDREKIAADNDVGKYTHFIIGDNRIMGVMLNENKDDLRGERGEYSTVDFLPLPTGRYFAWVHPNGMTVTVKVDD